MNHKTNLMLGGVTALLLFCVSPGVSHADQPTGDAAARKQSEQELDRLGRKHFKQTLKKARFVVSGYMLEVERGLEGRAMYGPVLYNVTLEKARMHRGTAKRLQKEHIGYCDQNTKRCQFSAKYHIVQMRPRIEQLTPPSVALDVKSLPKGKRVIAMWGAGQRTPTVFSWTAKRARAIRK